MNIGQMLVMTHLSNSTTYYIKDVFPRPPLTKAARQRIAEHKRRKSAARRKDAKRRVDGRGKHRVAISRANAAMRRAA
jgi:hypothetical protein